MWCVDDERRGRPCGEDGAARTGRRPARLLQPGRHQSLRGPHVRHDGRGAATVSHSFCLFFLSFPSLFLSLYLGPPVFFFLALFYLSFTIILICNLIFVQIYSSSQKYDEMC
jgi:hypothetical protein